MSILDGLQAIVKEKALQLQDNLKTSGIPIAFTQGYRSPEDQQKLIDNQKATGVKVTNATPMLSFHNYGLAFDIVPLKDGKAWYDAPKEVWEKIGITGELLGLQWGGRWISFKDLPHFEYHPGLSIHAVYDYFKKTGQVIIQKVLNPVALVILAAGVFF